MINWKMIGYSILGIVIGSIIAAPLLIVQAQPTPQLGVQCWNANGDRIVNEPQGSMRIMENHLAIASPDRPMYVVVYGTSFVCVQR